jgi:undecaprenyl-diphosphatase
MIQILSQFDITVTQFINNILPHNLFFDYFFSFFSLRGNSILIWFIIIVLIVAFEELKDHRFIVYFIIAFALTSLLTNVIIKNIFQRPRPYIRFNYETANQYCPKDYSFPSSHAATSFAAAAILSAFHKKRKYWFYGVAFMISLSRIYLHCHFSVDIATGAVIGYLISKIILRLTAHQVQTNNNS